MGFNSAFKGLNNIYIHMNTLGTPPVKIANRCHQLSDVAVSVGLKLCTFGTSGLVETVQLVHGDVQQFSNVCFACWASWHVGMCLGEWR
jgi:hypothetical protein